MPDNKPVLLDDLKIIVLKASEIDQDCAVLEQFFKQSSKDKVIERCDQLLKAMMDFREKVKSINKESYI